MAAFCILLYEERWLACRVDHLEYFTYNLFVMCRVLTVMRIDINRNPIVK